jgi:hypothetical protein
MTLYKQLLTMSVISSLSPPLLAGELNSPAGPSDTASAMYTIEDIYNRLNDGTAGTKRGATFSEPDAGPTGQGKSLDDVMDKAPAVDNTNGAATTEVKSGKKYWGLKSGEWGLQTGTATIPSCTPNPSAAPRFSDNGDGTVTDAYTCLMWLKNASCVGQQLWDDVDTSAKLGAIIDGASCTDYTGGTYSDWRVPSLSELIELSTSESKYFVKPTAPFTGVQADYYWSSTTFATVTAFAWNVNFDNGGVGRSVKSNPDFVWPLRGGE